MASGQEALAALRRKVAGLEGRQGIDRADLFTLGFGDVDEAIGGGLRRGVLHDLVAPGLPDCAALAGFAAALARRAAGGRAILWARQDYVELEAGRLDAHGLSELGLDPGGIVIVRARDPTGVLRAGAEAVRCDALGAVLIELWGAPKALDLTATRRLALSAGQSGVTVFLVHVLAEPDANAAASRWRVEASPSGALEANAPGYPVFRTTLLRHRAGYPEQSWVVEWDRDGRRFRKPAPLSRPVVSVPRPAAPAQARPAALLRRAG